MELETASCSRVTSHTFPPNKWVHVFSILSGHGYSAINDTVGSGKGGREHGSSLLGYAKSRESGALAKRPQAIDWRALRTEGSRQSPEQPAISHDLTLRYHHKR